MEASKILGIRLKQLRGKRTQEEISKSMGLSRARYSHYENNRVEPDMDTLRKIADFYGVTLDYLLGRSNDPRLNEEKDKEAESKTDMFLERYYKLPEDKKRLVMEKLEAYVDGLTYADNDNDN